MQPVHVGVHFNNRAGIEVVRNGKHGPRSADMVECKNHANRLTVCQDSILSLTIRLRMRCLFLELIEDFQDTSGVDTVPQDCSRCIPTASTVIRRQRR